MNPSVPPPHPGLLPHRGEGKNRGFPFSPLCGSFPTGKRERGRVSSDPGLPSRGKEMRRKRYGQTRWKGHQAVVNQRKMHAYFFDGERVALAKERLKNQELAEENRGDSGRLV
jgi:hypothetical protein